MATIGQYKGIDITQGTDPDVKAQIDAINAGSNVPVATPTYTSPDTTQTTTPELDISGIFGTVSNKKSPYSGDDIYSNINQYGSPLTAGEESSVRDQVLSQYQGEIDAAKNAYATLLKQTQTQGQGRLGESTAQQARAGLLGSDFGQAQTDKTRAYNLSQEQVVLESQASAIANIMSRANAAARQEIADRRAAKTQGYAAYQDYLAGQDERRANTAGSIANILLGQGINPSDPIARQQIDEYLKQNRGLGITTRDILNQYYTLERATLKEAPTYQTLGAGSSIYDPVTGEIIATAPKFEDTGVDYGYEVNGISSQAQNIVDLINVSGGTVDDYIKGSSVAAQALRNEVFSALNQQGGVTQKSTSLYQEAKNVIDKMISEKDWKKLGYSSKLGGQFTTGFGDMQARAQTVNAILARDNLGLLKGAMSDKDLAFIESMSAGVPGGTISESYAKERMEAIQKKLEEKINQFQPSGTSTQEQSQIQQMRSDGLSDEDIEQILGRPISFNAVGNTSASNRPQRNNNPLNIKESEWTRQYAGVTGTDRIPATDGGYFLTFDSPQSGFNAAKRLLKEGSYKNLTLDAAMRRWSGGGYGAEILPQLRNKKIGELSESELNTLIDAMARREGYYA